MQKVREILEKEFQQTGWAISKPKDGWEELSYIASVGEKKYFVKFGINAKVMKRLATLRVTPQIIATGEIGSETYMIQEFIKNSYVPPEWFENNLKQLANFLAGYHQDEELLQIVKQTMPLQNLSIEGELNMFTTQINAIQTNTKYNDVKQGIDLLKHRYKQLPQIKAVPVHDDPNTKNIFLTPHGLQMVDWNKIRLSDPLSDTGAILWWYVRPEKWEEYFNYAGIEVTEETIERVYLSAAKMTMGFLLWHIENGKEYSIALKDFTAALQKQPNPRSWFREAD